MPLGYYCADCSWCGPEDELVLAALHDESGTELNPDDEDYEEWNLCPECGMVAEGFN